MKIYNKDKITKLYRSLENNLNENQMIIFREILEQYNLLYDYARQQKNKENDYFNQMEKCIKMEQQIKDYEQKIKTQNNTIDVLKKQIKDIKATLILD